MYTQQGHRADARPATSASSSSTSRGTTTAADNTTLNLTAAEARIAGYRYANQPVLLIHGADVDWSLGLPVCADRLAPARVTAAQVDIQPSGQGTPAATGGVTRRL